MIHRLMHHSRRRMLLAALCMVAALALLPRAAQAAEAVATAPELKIAYSDWPGWVAWDIAIQKDWFKEEGVNVKFEWFEYAASMEAFSAGQVDAVCMTNGDAMVTGATGKPSKGILINDYSNGNDMVVARPGIESVTDLKGKKIGVEIGFIPHLLLLSALEKNGLAESDVELVKTLTHETPQTLASGQVDAIVAWQPNSGQALKALPGSKAVFSSADAPGLIYDLLCVSNESLSANRAEWVKVCKVWGRVAAYMADPANEAELLKILSARVGLTPEEYKPLLAGTKIMGVAENLKAFEKSDELTSVYGSSKLADKFNVDNKVYETPQDLDSYLDPSLMAEIK